MAKTGLIFTSYDDPGKTFLHSGSSMQDGVVTIQKILHFEVPPGEDPRQYSDIDVYAHPNFPKKYAALSEDPRYKFYGNASVQKDIADGRWFHASCDFSTSDPNATDADGEPVTHETPPWKLRPDNIQFTYPEIIVPFENSYDAAGELFTDTGRVDEDGNKILVAVRPVRNSAGDKILLESSIRNIQMSFTYATEEWDIDNALTMGNSINEEEITVCGLLIPAMKALLLPPEVNYITVYEENS